MRQIRFRAWQTNLKEMMDHKCLMYTNAITMHNSEADVILMQYIGLKDKSGVEVYEGDVLVCDSGVFHEVIFESYFACFNTKNLLSGEVSDIAKDGMAECFQVVGNIYQNKDLLEVK